MRSTPSRCQAPALARALGAAFLSCGVLALAPGSAFGHAIVQPKASRPADLQRYTLTIPNEETGLATDRVRLQVPSGFDFVLIEETPGWEARVVRRQDRIAELRWSGGSIPPDGYREFHFIARNRIEEGTIAWRVLQRYERKEVAWIGPPESEFPASRTNITEKAIPVDTVGVMGEKEDEGGAQGTGQAGDAKPTAAKVDERDELALGLGGGALAIALVSLIVTLGRRRRQAT